MNDAAKDRAMESTPISRKFRNQMRRNEIAKLPKNAELGCGWFGLSFFHLCRVTELKNHSNHFFFCFNQDSYGMAVIENDGSFLWLFVSK
jgi:hypothetical protein